MGKSLWNPLGKVSTHTVQAEIYWLIEMMEAAQKLSLEKYGQSLESLITSCEKLSDDPKVVSLMDDAQVIIGTPKQYANDYHYWEEDRRRGNVEAPFKEWRKGKRSVLKEESFLKVLYFKWQEEYDTLATKSNYIPSFDINRLFSEVPEIQDKHPDWYAEYQARKTPR